jgi:hypothetical protein
MVLKSWEICEERREELRGRLEQPVVVVYPCNPSTLEAEAGGL